MNEDTKQAERIVIDYGGGNEETARAGRVVINTATRTSAVIRTEVPAGTSAQEILAHASEITNRARMGVCAECGSEFADMRAGATFCSRRCAATNGQRRRRAANRPIVAR